MKDYYEILGVPRNASNEDVKRAYRILAHQYHPDTTNGNEKRFKEINEAYRILSKEQSRNEYDKEFSSQYTAKTESNHYSSSSKKQEQSSKKKTKLSGWVTTLIIICIFSFIKLISSGGNNSINSNILSASDTSNIKNISSNDAYVVPQKQTDTTSFPFNNSNDQYGWYDQHNVGMAYRCYPGGSCSAQDWAYAIYNDRNDLRGTTLKKQADEVYIAYMAQFPTEKCVTESGVKICDLSYEVKKTYGDKTREVSFQANAIDCVNLATGNQTQIQGNSVQVSGGNTYCASDLGAVYIDPTIQVAKYFNKIMRDSADSPYYIPTTYGGCIWTYDDGNGAIPNMQVSSNIGPSSGFNVEAFCKNGNNQVDIYSY